MGLKNFHHVYSYMGFILQIMARQFLILVQRFWLTGKFLNIVFPQCRERRRWWIKQRLYYQVDSTGDCFSIFNMKIMQQIQCCNEVSSYTYLFKHIYLQMYIFSCHTGNTINARYYYMLIL